jgi:hypothetical protein
VTAEAYLQTQALLLPVGSPAPAVVVYSGPPQCGYWSYSSLRRDLWFKFSAMPCLEGSWVCMSDKKDSSMLDGGGGGGGGIGPAMQNPDQRRAVVDSS